MTVSRTFVTSMALCVTATTAQEAAVTTPERALSSTPRAASHQRFCAATRDEPPDLGVGGRRHTATPATARLSRAGPLSLSGAGFDVDGSTPPPADRAVDQTDIADVRLYVAPDTG